MKNNIRRIIVVLGMHRSGTSAITRGLKVLGIDLGTNFWPAGPDNERGFWESVEITSFNESLLKKIDSTMERIGPLDPDLLQSDLLSSERALAINILKSKLVENSIFGFKDPRVTILLPFWQSVFKELDLDDSYVFAVRNPLNIAESLLKRNAILLENSMLLWYKHIYSGLMHTQDKQRVFVNYDYMLDNPNIQLERVSKALSLPLPKSYQKELKEYSKNFLSTSLRHHKFSRKDLIDNKNIPVFMTELYFLLDKLSKDEMDSGSPEFKKKWTEFEGDYCDYLPLLTIVDGLEKKQDIIKNEINDSQKFFDNTLESIKDFNNQLKYLKRALSHGILFDEKFYLMRNPDVVLAKVDPYRHFLDNGIKEGRDGVIPESIINKLDSAKRTVLVVSHEASRTGAPILALNICSKLQKHYNVIVLFIGGGSLSCFFEEHCNVVYGPLIKDSELVMYVINKICEKYKIKFCIANSIESRYVLKPLYSLRIPSVLLVHEFFGDPYPNEEFIEAFRWARSIVFSSKIVQNSAQNEMTQELLLESHVLPQGKAVIPITNTKSTDDFKIIKNIIYNKKYTTKPFVVLGAGTRCYRKGLDLFIDSAAKIKKEYPESDIVMIWIGANISGTEENEFSLNISKKIEDDKLDDCILLFDEIENLEEIYKIADLFYLPSRQDPLPNVAIDAMLHGIPVVCFSECTGIAEALELDILTRSCIIPWMDTTKAVEKIYEIYSSNDYKRLLSNKVAIIGKKLFNMDAYVKSIIYLAEKPSLLSD